MAAATLKIERFVIIVNGWKPLTIITKRSILDVAAVLDPALVRSLCHQLLTAGGRGGLRGTRSKQSTLKDTNDENTGRSCIFSKTLLLSFRKGYVHQLLAVALTEILITFGRI